MIGEECDHVAPTDNLGLPLGWFDANDSMTYQNLVQRMPDRGVSVEVGVWQGRSLCSIADVMRKKDLKVYAVDTFKGSTSARDVVHDCDGKLQEIFEDNIKRHHIADQVTIIPKDSVSAAEEITEQVDLVFIDADHAPECVHADIHAWLSKVKVDGVLAGHDYQWVKGVVHNELESFGYDVQTDNGNFWWIQKK